MPQTDDVAVSPSPQPSPAVTLDLLTGCRFAGEGVRAAAPLGLGFGLTDREVCHHGGRAFHLATSVVSNSIANGMYTGVLIPRSSACRPCQDRG